MKNLEKKLRIQTFDADFNMEDDRLVSQDTELYKGPAKVHEGPMKVEVCLFENTDVDAFIEYLKLLKGSLPIERVKGKRGRKRGPGKEVGSSRTDFIPDLEAAAKPIVFLRELGFVATTIDYMKDMGYELKVPKVYQSPRYTAMIRVIKKAKNPMNTKYDPILVALISQGKIVLLKDGEVLKEMKLKEPLDSTIKVPAKAKMRFPTFLTMDERNQFRIDMERLRTNPDEKPTRLYTRWVREIAKFNEGQDFDFPKIDLIPNPYA